MRKTRTTLVLIIGLMTFATTAGAPPAIAGSWFVNGTKLAKGGTIATAPTAAIDESTNFTIPDDNVKLTCTGGSGKVVSYRRPQIQGEASWSAESVTFEGCSEISPFSCTVQTNIETEPIVASFETGTSPLDRIRFAPKNGRDFATIAFKGTCSESGEQSIGGQVVVHLKEGQIEGAIQLLEPLGTTENNSMELFGSKAYVEKGKGLLKLASGLPWSFH